MTIVFADPFAFYDDGLVDGGGDHATGMEQVWSEAFIEGGSNGSIQVFHTGGRDGRGCVELHGLGPRLIAAISSTTECICQFAFKVLTEGQSYDFSLFFREGTTNHGEVRFDENDLIIKDSAGSQVGTETIVLDDEYWHLIEVKFSYGDTGTVQVRIDETSWLTVSGEDFSGAATTGINKVFFKANNVGLGSNGSRVGDFILIDTTVSPITDFIGDQAVFYSPAASDVVSEFTPLTGTNHAELVDGTDLSTTEYVYSTGTSQLELYQNNEADQFDPLNTVTAVAPVVFAGLYSGTSGVGLIPVVRLGGVDYPRPEYDAFTSETPELRVCEYIYEHPGLLAPFTIDQVEAFTFGFKTDSS